MTGKTVKLTSGYDCPLLGYGTHQETDPAELKADVKAAVEAGYRHIDIGCTDGNESVIGEALEELYVAGVVKREELFITVRLRCYYFQSDRVIDHLKRQLKSVRTDYADLYLLHWILFVKIPEPTASVVLTACWDYSMDYNAALEDAWQAMERCVELRLARSIGVANFSVRHLERLLECKVKPAVNQIKWDTDYQNTKLMEFCQSNQIVMVASSCPGVPRTIKMPDRSVKLPVNMVDDYRIAAIGKKHGKSAAQVVLRWEIQRKVIVIPDIPKGTTHLGLEHYYEVFGFSLGDDDMQVLADIDAGKQSYELAYWNIAKEESPSYLPYLWPCKGGSS